MGKNNALTLLKSAKETAVKNRAAAIQKVSKDFDEEIAAYDMAIRQLSGTPAKKAAPKKAAPKKAAKKAAPKKVAKKAAPKKAAKKAAPKKAAKKAAPKKVAKKIVPKKIAIPGSYPKEGTILEKMSFVINEQKRFLNIQEIADIVKKHEPSQKTEDIKPRFGKHIHKFRAQGSIVSYQDKATNTFYYGLPGYMKEGKPLAGHEHAQAPSAEKK